MDKYGALVFLFTWIVDFLLLREAAWEERGILSRLRCGAGAAIGGIYAVVSLRTDRPGMLILVLLAMGLTAFGLGDYLRWGKFLFLWLVAHAMAAGMGNMDGWFLVLASALLCLLALVGRDGGAGSGYASLTIRFGEKTVSLRALRDSGNLLADPVTGESVLIVSPWVGSKLLGLSPYELMHPVETVASGKVPGLRLIPYNAVGRSGGLLAALRFQHVAVDGKVSSRIVAFSPNPIGDGRRFEALAGGAV